MKTSAFEFPSEQSEAYRKARRYEWLTIVYLLSVVILMYAVLGSSQAMKAAWIEDLLSLVPPIVFLIATRIAIRPPNKRFPYGYHRAVSIAFLCASLTLFAVGAWLLGDAVVKLTKAEHPTIGSVSIGGRVVWLGWLMLPVLAWSAIPALLLGRSKLPLARKLHDKVLFTDAEMNKADWMTAAAAFVGVIGIGLGYWWADATAATIISLSILRDGFQNLREVVTNLMDETPKSVEGEEFDPLPDRVRDHLEGLPWVKAAQVRMREEGHVYFGEAFLVVDDETPSMHRLEDAARGCRNLHWRVHDLVITVVSELEMDEPTE
ncbi:MAG: cation diffusion facilitator family transporter [Planctomycetaceae bacterium]